MKILTELEKEQICDTAVSYYGEGGFYCSEAIVKAVLESVEEEYDSRMIATASGFAVGLGGAECLCGAVSGGVMVVSYLHGRTEPHSNKVAEAMKRAREIQSRFVQRNKVTCCKVLTRGMQKGTPDHMIQCKRFVREVTADVLDLI